MRLSDEKITHMTHMILKGLLDADLIDPIEDDGTIRRAMRRAITDELKTGQEIDDTVRHKIESLSKHVVDGSTEWDALYGKYYDEEELRRGRSSSA